ncbi:MAG: hypothetical protein J7L15_03745, partial [Clostridiales bacterium]|nr:hypothetical protein [Clostridiales bacterium]
MANVFHSSGNSIFDSTCISNINGNMTTASTASTASTALDWEELNSNEMTFKIGDKEITFKDNDLIYLKEMLNEWVLEN